MTQVPDLSPGLWEAMMEDPPPRDDALCRDVYDQVQWMAGGMLMVPLPSSQIWRHFFWTEGRMGHLTHLVEAQSGTLAVRKASDRWLVDRGWSEPELWEARHKLRDFHMFKVEETPFSINGDRIFRIPTTAKDRMTGVTKVAPFQFRGELESMAALGLRYHMR